MKAAVNGFLPTKKRQRTAVKAPPPVFFLRSPAATDRNFVIFAIGLID